MICHIIALAVNLASKQELKGSVLARTLKKSTSELKNHIKEVGLSVEPFKNPKLSDDKNEQDDISIYIPHGGRVKSDQQFLAPHEKRERALSQENKK